MDTWGTAALEFEYIQPCIPSFQTTTFDNGVCSTSTWNSNPQASSSKTTTLFPQCDTVARKSSHQRKKPDNHIPRPPNAFILFRASFIKSQHVSSMVETNHSTLSKIIGLTWTHLPEPERQVWHAKARTALDDHKKRFPAYAFKPSAKSSAKVKPVSEAGMLVPATPTKRKRSAPAASPAESPFTAPETPSTSKRATVKRIPRASPSTSAPKPKRKSTSNRAPVPKDVARCEKIAQLLVGGTRGTALDDAIAEFDRTHVPVYETTFLEVQTEEAFRAPKSVTQIKVEEVEPEEVVDEEVHFFQETGLTYTHSSKEPTPLRVKKTRSASVLRASPLKLCSRPSRRSSPPPPPSPAVYSYGEPHAPFCNEDVFYSPYQASPVYSSYQEQQAQEAYSTYQQHVYEDTPSTYPTPFISPESTGYDFSAFDFNNTGLPAPPSLSPTDCTITGAAFEPLPSFANFLETTSGCVEPRRLSITTDFSQWSQPMGMVTQEYNDSTFDPASSPPFSSPSFATYSPSSYGSPESSMPATPLMQSYQHHYSSVASSWVLDEASIPYSLPLSLDYQSHPSLCSHYEPTSYGDATVPYVYDPVGLNPEQKSDAQYAPFFGIVSS